MKKFVIQVDMQVADLWIEDGFDLSKEGIEAMEELILQRLPWAKESEFKVKVKVISQPDEKVIQKLQGYIS